MSLRCGTKRICCWKRSSAKFPRYCIIGLAVALMGLSLGCAGGPPEKVRHMIGFGQRPTTDTSQRFSGIFRVFPRDSVFSLEISGTSDTTESRYTLKIFVGIYGSPDFQKGKLKLNPDSIQMSWHGPEFIRDFSTSRIYDDARPWDMSSLHLFSVNKDSILKSPALSGPISFVMTFGGYAMYDSYLEAIDSVVVIDPWLNALRESLRK